MKCFVVVLYFAFAARGTVVHRQEDQKCELSCNPFHSSVSVCGSFLSLCLLYVFISARYLGQMVKKIFSRSVVVVAVVSGKEEWVAIYCMQSDIYVYCIVDTTIIMNKHFVGYAYCKL